MQLDNLNNEQHRAVETTEGPLMIVAGPGTGKTKTLTARTAYLLESGKAKPQEILALTFTNKAAAEMRQRIQAQLSSHSSLPRVTTFHALCHEILRNHQAEPITFITEHERLLIIKELRKNALLKKLSTRELALEISRLKNLPSEHVAEDAPLNKLLADYNHTLRQRDLYDFDDLLQKMHQLLTTTPLVLPYMYLLVDEFQDTNILQYELLHLLRKNDNVCVIGDPLQSIYGFRGASSDVFERFKADFPHYHEITLTTNYRSGVQVVALANAIFPYAPKLSAHVNVEGRVQTVEVLNEYSEAVWIINQIEQALGGTDFLRSHQIDQTVHSAYNFRDFAILYRTHYVGKTIKRALVESGIPYQVAGEGSLYEQPAIWAIISVVKYLAEPSGTQRLHLSSLRALRQFSSAQLDVLLRKLQTKLELPLTEFVYFIATTLDLDQKNLTQLASTLVRFEKAGLQEYIKYINELDDTTFYDSRADAISLMTIHAAKGLEFRHVFLIAGEEGILPYQRKGGEPTIEEERRLFYVAATRAKESFYLLHAKHRAGEARILSRFAKILSPDILTSTQDEAMAAQQKRQQKHQAKRRQATLFDL